MRHYKLGSLLLFMGFGFWSCSNRQRGDVLFHYSAMDALKNGVYTGEVPIGELKTMGDFGIGTIDRFYGELVTVEGIAYRIKPEGTVEQLQDAAKVPYASYTFFRPDTTFVLQGKSLNEEELKQNILQKTPSVHRFYAFRVSGEFSSLTLGGANKMYADDPESIAKALQKRPIYQKQNVKGTIVGFFYPAYFSEFDLVPVHMHFISDDRKIGGHLLKAVTSEKAKITIDIDIKNDIMIRLPHTRKYDLYRKNKTANTD